MAFRHIFVQSNVDIVKTDVLRFSESGYYPSVHYPITASLSLPAGSEREQSNSKSTRMITIPFSLGQSTRITLELFNLKGQKVATLVKSEMPVGSHQVSVHADRYPAGVYFYRLIAPNGALMRKMIVLP